MVNPREQTERMAFVQASIDATHEALSNPGTIAHFMTRMGFETWAYHERLNRRLFAAEVAGGAIRIPETQVQRSGVPVVAIAPGETPVLSPDFARLSPQAKTQMRAQLESWRAVDPEQCIAEAEYFVRRKLEDEPIAFPDVFTPSNERHAAHAMVFSPYVSIRFRPEAFSVSQDFRKGIFVQPVLGLHYEGPDTPVFGEASMVHEQRHIWQHERLRLFDNAVVADRKPYRFRMELEAYRDGARVVHAQLDSGRERSELSEIDKQQLMVEALRIKKNIFYRDPFTPSPELMAALPNLIIDDLSP